ncbi:hypothetical protein N7474_010664 [Penicillium riverlandense]|uniref:uncharacterized protein n=1 Tax=Penicillium riverlandense TaxID=1903569 RepID=UPI0025499970|nr:uncharacterized protein N7474_010664 [Penicillium riverlandense]KAJ5807072.1 hypothetical protein N7474_010664 [Penicillium riverlandense]
MFWGSSNNSDKEEPKSKPDEPSAAADKKLPVQLPQLGDHDEDFYGDLYSSYSVDSTETPYRYAAYANRLRTILLSAHRYVAYTSDIGESFRPVAHPWLIRSAYGISWAYLLGDVGHEGYKAYLRNRRALAPAGDAYKDASEGESEGGINSTGQIFQGMVTGNLGGQLNSQAHAKELAPGPTAQIPLAEDYRLVMAQRAVFQSLASMGLPAFTIHSVVKYTGKMVKNAKSTLLRTWAPIGNKTNFSKLGLAVVPFLPYLFDHPVEEAVEWSFRTAIRAYGGEAAVRTLPGGAQDTLSHETEEISRAAHLSWEEYKAERERARQTRKTGDTIVHLAASKGDGKFIQTVLAKSVDFQVRNNRGVTPLARAAHRGHTAVVELLISAKAKVDDSDNRALTPLHAAAYHGSDMVVQVLLDAGANPYRTAHYRGTALNMAIRNGHLSTVSLLLKRMRQPPDKTDIWSSALDFAAEYGRTEGFQQLIAAGFKISDKTLQVAASAGRAKIVKIILSQGRFSENARREALLSSVKLGYISVVRLLIGTGLNISSEDPKLAEAVGHSGNIKTLRLLDNTGVDLNRSSILRCAASRGHTAMVEYFAYAGWLNHDMCRSALLDAASVGHSAVVKTLLDCGFEFEGKEREIAISNASATGYLASTAGHLAILDLLLEPGAQSDIRALYPAVCAGQVERVQSILTLHNNSSTSDRQHNLWFRKSLWKAAEDGHTVIVELLLNAGVAPDDDRFDRDSALYRAAGNGHKEVVDLLVKAGADIFRENHSNYHLLSNYDKHGYTALYAAAGGGHVDVIDSLISSGAPVSFQGAEGHTALHAAARAGHCEAAEFLINAGANISIQAYSEATPLHYAAQYNRFRVVKLLLNRGADPSILDREGRSALSRAIEFHHAEVVEILIAAGNRTTSPCCF